MMDQFSDHPINERRNRRKDIQIFANSDMVVTLSPFHQICTQSLFLSDNSEYSSRHPSVLPRKHVLVMPASPVHIHFRCHSVPLSNVIIHIRDLDTFIKSILSTRIPWLNRRFPSQWTSGLHIISFFVILPNRSRRYTGLKIDHGCLCRCHYTIWPSEHFN